MRKFSGYEYIQIAIANAWGLDKATWDVRLDWVNEINDQLEDYDAGADEPILYRKAVRALRDAENSIPTGFCIGLDSTTSGYQLMSVLIGDDIGARNTNLINTGKREDFYTKVAIEMNKLPNVDIDRSTIKKPCMTTAYGSKAQPMKVFGNNTPELAAFYKILDQEAPGAMELMKDIQSCWRSDVLYHKWTLPDGHVVRSKVTEPIDKRIEIQEFGGKSFTHRININQPTKYGISLLANVIHSYDAYVVREVIRRCDFEVYTIHDAYYCSPVNMNQLRQHYLDILIELAKSDTMDNVLSDILDRHAGFIKRSNNLSLKMHSAEYFLS